MAVGSRMPRHPSATTTRRSQGHHTPYKGHFEAYSSASAACGGRQKCDISVSKGVRYLLDVPAKGTMPGLRSMRPVKMCTHASWALRAALADWTTESNHATTSRSSNAASGDKSACAIPSAVDHAGLARAGSRAAALLTRPKSSGRANTTRTACSAAESRTAWSRTNCTGHNCRPGWPAAPEESYATPEQSATSPPSHTTSDERAPIADYQAEE